jgi:hypothetical protein
VSVAGCCSLKDTAQRPPKHSASAGARVASTCSKSARCSARDRHLERARVAAVVRERHRLDKVLLEGRARDAVLTMEQQQPLGRLRRAETVGIEERVEDRSPRSVRA